MWISDLLLAHDGHLRVKATHIQMWKMKYTLTVCIKSSKVSRSWVLLINSTWLSDHQQMWNIYKSSSLGSFAGEDHSGMTQRKYISNDLRKAAHQTGKGYEVISTLSEVYPINATWTLSLESHNRAYLMRITYAMRGSSLLMPEVGGEYPDSFELTGTQQQLK